jgi:acyl transferase domain-containing protein/NAD(P)H-dependent flavin oxidoreductase YrpB (nitropropane dioxygenase family)
VLDVTFCDDAALARAFRNLSDALRVTSGQHEFGIRLQSSSIAAAMPLLELLAPRTHTVILTAGPMEVALPASSMRTLLIEVTDSEQLANIENVDGIVASGRECGGWVGIDSGFILLQRLLDSGLPVYVRGVAGPRTVAAVRAGGAAGFVLDDQLLLMPESPLPVDWRVALDGVAAHDSVVLGEALGAPCRVWAPKRTGTLRALAAAAREVELSDDADRCAAWRRRMETHVGWGDPARWAWPCGQAIDAAATIRDRYRSTSDLIGDFLRQSRELIELAQKTEPLAPGGPLARDHGTRYPIVQGPMTRVSDTSDFAQAVAAGGGLPLLALALLTRDDVRSLLQSTHRRLEGKAWGVGILGFTDHDLCRAQIEEIIAQKVPFALIAGGNAEQATQLEAAGIPTYLHAPVPALLRMFVGNGIRRFVFEGRESGGHVGPLGSLHLWERMVDVLLETLPRGAESQTSILFAGGVHDARSALMAAVIAAPLAARGVRTGVLMGSAYLFTREAVASGAIVDEYQKQALACRRTVTLESAPGQENRCALTSFAHEFSARRVSLLREKVAGDKMRQSLDQFTLGRLRMATKGLARQGSQLVHIDIDSQRQRGMYMLGEVATLRSSVITIEALHAEVSGGSTELLRQAELTDAPMPVATARRPADVAIIGMATLLPGANGIEEFWRNILDRRHAITEVPADRFDINRHFDPDPKAPDRTYSKWGGFCDAIDFDPVRFGMPPQAVSEIGVSQLMAVELTHRALADAGYESRRFDREHTAVIIADIDHGGDGDAQRVTRARIREMTDEPPPGFLASVGPDSFAGSLGNVTPGRVANVFDLGGANYSVDAACGSSLAAVDCAVRELETGRCSMAIAGGIDTGQLAHNFINFSKTQALSPKGQPRCFDTNADGIVISEGISLVVLKRLSDAERDGDRIYAVIKAVAGSSDGRAKGITAPRPEGQIRALERAYAAAGVNPATVGYYEAHGTGTMVGDRTEADSFNRVLREAGATPKSCAIGSVKNLIGHTKTAAGATGLIKAALALHHRVLPPQADVTNPLAVLDDPQGPLYLLTEPAPWLASNVHPRRAGVSAFGFGGTNFHAVLEEHRALSGRDPGACQWPAELIAIRAASAGGLQRMLEGIHVALERGARPSLRDLAFTCALEASAGAYLFTAVVSTLDELRTALAAAVAVPPLPIAASNGKTALLFPGQGSQYVGAARELALYFEDVRELLELLDVDRLLYPPSRFDDASRQDDAAALMRTEVAQPVIGAISAGYSRLLQRLGLHVDMTAGHSYGEYVALHVAGVFSDVDLLRLSAERGRLMASASGGAMLAVQAGREEIERMVERFPSITIAAYNRPRQVVVCGAADDVRCFAEALERAGLSSTPIPVSGAFHSNAMEAARGPLAQALSAIDVGRPRIPVYANTTAAAYEDGSDAIRGTLARQLLSPVRFVQEIEAMYAAGARTFIEAGPGRILTDSVTAILGERAHLAVALDPRRGALAGFLQSLATLLANGVDLSLATLHRGRSVQHLDLHRLAETTTPPAPSATTWRVNGTRAERAGAQKSQRPALLSQPLINVSATKEKPLMPDHDNDSPLLQGYLAHQETMRRFLDTQQYVMRMYLGNGTDADVAAMTLSPAAPPIPKASPLPLAPESAVAVVPEVERSPVAATPPAAPIKDAKAALAQLKSIVSNATGYPEEMIGTSVDIEADLGIDSIRRIEILNHFTNALPAEAAAHARERAEALARARTLEQLVEIALASEQAVAAPAVLAISPRFNSEVAGGECPRFVMRGRPVPLVSSAPAALSGTYIVTSDSGAVSSAVNERLTAAGANVVEIPANACRKLESVEKHLLGRVVPGTPVAGVVHLASLAPHPMPEEFEAWRDFTATQTKSLFWQLSFCLRNEAPPRRIVSATRLGGHFGRGRECGPGLPIGGGNSGLLRTYAIEHPTHIRCLDFDESMDADETARCIIDELHIPGEAIEVGYRHGVRTVFEPVAVPLPSRTDPEAGPAMPGAGDVVLITGGARGITAEIANAIAVPGMTMVLIGRARLAGASDTTHDGLESIESLRQSLIDKAARAGVPRTPSEIEEEFRELLRDREIHRNLDRLREAGVSVQYRSVDVRSSEEFSRAIEDVYETYGRINAVIHGAGMIADKLLADKKPEAFELVYDTKVDSTFLLYRYLRPESLKLVMLFTSVAGRFGSRGQSDYAAANETLNRFAWRLRNEWPDTRVMAINWNPWTGTGMSNDTLNGFFRERGIVPISIANGTRFATEEILKGAADDVEIIAGHGPWAASAMPATESAIVTHGDPAAWPGVEAISE